jgi:pimeloyl-ACP methyl ester carboxylesterase
MAKSFIDVGDARLCVDAIGEPADPAVLLISGATASMDWWPPELCKRLAAAGRHVIRYDHRDTGESTASPLGHPSYTGADLTADPLRVLDGLGVRQAHLVGVSMGGGIAQDIAVQQPDRVLSLTLIATSAAFDRADPTPLPPPEPRLAELGEDDDAVADWSESEAVVERMVEVHRAYAGSLGLDEERVRSTCRQVVARTQHVRASVTNHWLVVGAEADSGQSHTMAEITAPTLVLHGSDDPLFPVEHGRALAAEIRGARLIELEGMGHEVPPSALWDVVVPAIVAHTVR